MSAEGRPPSLGESYHCNGILDTMRATIDKAGRLVIPKPLRDAVGLTPGEVDLELVGAELRVRPASIDESVLEKDGRLVITGPADVAIDDDQVRALRRALQR